MIKKTLIFAVIVMLRCFQLFLIEEEEEEEEAAASTQTMTYNIDSIVPRKWAKNEYSITVRNMESGRSCKVKKVRK